MRIIGGSAAGRLLKVPKGLSVRPTPDLVRQAVFNSLGSKVQGTRVLELFGGTGALSFECLSRGAEHAVCVEKSSRHARIIRENYRALALAPGAFDLRVQDAYAAIKQLAADPARFSLVMADPPYGPKNQHQRSESDAQKCLDNEHLAQLLDADGIFVLGHARRDQLTLPSHWQLTKELKHGDSLMKFLRPNASP